MTATHVGVVCVLMIAEHQVPRRLDPVETVVLVVEVFGIPELDLQPRGLDIIFRPQKGRRLDVCDDGARSETRWVVPDGFTAGLFRQPVVDRPEQCALRISVATGEEVN